jgi:hypothetical protein
MALSERTINKHNIKRAEVFKAHGLNTLDVQYAHPKFEHYTYDEQDCVLCGHRHIKWLFSIKFDAPQGLVALAKVAAGIDRDKEVVLSYVGSKCITDWLQALPETPEKLEALKRWHAEMEVCKRAMKAKVVEDLCRQAGYESPQDAFETYQDLPSDARYSLKRKQVRQLANNAYGIKHKRSSRGTVKSWLANLAEALQNWSSFYCPRRQSEETKEERQPVATTSRMSNEDFALLERGRAAWTNRHKLQVYHQQAFASMGKQARRANGFVSDSQRRFYTDLLKRLEG